MTVKDATAKIYLSQPNIFNMVDMLDQVKLLLNRPKMYEDSIKRKLRELRNDEPGVYNYKVESQSKSIYRKIKTGQQSLL